MPITRVDIYPLAHRLHACIPAPLRRWTGFPANPDDRDRLADARLMACADAGFTGKHTGNDETSIQAVIISGALTGFVTRWGCRYGHLDEEGDRAQTALVTAIGGTVLEPGHYALREGTPITVDTPANS